MNFFSGNKSKKEISKIGRIRGSEILKNGGSLAKWINTKGDSRAKFSEKLTSTITEMYLYINELDHEIKKTEKGKAKNKLKSRKKTALRNFVISLELSPPNSNESEKTIKTRITKKVKEIYKAKKLVEEKDMSRLDKMFTFNGVSQKVYKQIKSKILPGSIEKIGTNIARKNGKRSLNEIQVVGEKSKKLKGVLYSDYSESDLESSTEVPTESTTEYTTEDETSIQKKNMEVSEKEEKEKLNPSLDLTVLQRKNDDNPSDSETQVEEVKGGEDIEINNDNLVNEQPEIAIRASSGTRSGPTIPVSSFSRKAVNPLKRMDIPKDGHITSERMPIGQAWRTRKSPFPGGSVPITNYHSSFINPANPIIEYQKEKYPQMFSSSQPLNDFSTQQSYTVYKMLNPKRGLVEPVYEKPFLDGEEQEAYVKKQMFDQATMTTRTGSGVLPPFYGGYRVNNYT